MPVPIARYRCNQATAGGMYPEQIMNVGGELSWYKVAQRWHPGGHGAAPKLFRKALDKT